MALVTAVDVLKRAAEIVSTSWAGGPTNCRDAQGRSIPLFSDTRSDTGRARLHPEAASFSMYGAIVKASGELGVPLPHTMWVVLQEVVWSKGCRGGLNLYNAGEGRTAAECAAVLTQAASVFEKLPAAMAAPATEEV